MNFPPFLCGSRFEEHLKLTKQKMAEAKEVSDEELSRRLAAEEFIERQHTKCQTTVRDILIQDRVMQHLMAGMEDRGCRVFYKNFFHCRQCEGNDHGGYWDPDEGVVICENNLEEKEMVRDTMLHEGVHAFDDCRADVDWSNCVHHACSEIRAANLSGDCSFKAELARGHFNIRAQHQECVRRRAMLSVIKNPNCPSKEAEWAVNKAWDRCYADHEPFGQVPN